MVHEIITQRIIELLENGTVPWKKPWNSVAPANLISKRPYRGINALLLNALNYECPYFLTFKQAKQLGGSIQRGEKGCPIVFWQFIEKETETGKAEIPLLRYYTVFNVSQCAGIIAPETETAKPLEPIGACERLVNAMPQPPKIEHGGDQAAYFPSADTVRMPFQSAFVSTEEYYSSLFHELTHSTGHAKRLNRAGVAESEIHFGSQKYSNEELIAEMGSSFLCAHAGIENRTIENSAAYINGWLARLRGEKRLIVTAAGQAQRASDYILGTLPPEPSVQHANA